MFHLAECISFLCQVKPLSIPSQTFKKHALFFFFRDYNNRIKRVLHRIIHSSFQQGQKELEALQRCPQQRKKGMYCTIFTDVHLMVPLEANKADVTTVFTLKAS